MKIEWAKVWEFIKANWKILAAAIVGFIVGILI